MQIMITIFNQVLMMFLLAAVGLLLYRSGKITDAGSKSIGNILIYVSLPCVVVKGFMVERTTERLISLGVSTAAAVTIFLIGILIARICFKKDPMAVYAVSFPNPGFFGIPIILASLSEGAVFYVVPLVACINMGQWTYGANLLTGKTGRITAKRVFTAPFMVGIIIGLLLFFTQLPLPGVLTTALNYCAGLNTPLAMFTVGIYLAQTNVLKMLKRVMDYKIAAARLVLVPLVTVAILTVLPASFNEIRYALLIGMSSSVGSNIAVYAQLYDADYTYAVETVVISVLFSIITIPLIVGLAGLIWG